MAPGNLARIRIEIPQEQIAAFCHRNQVRRLALFGSVLREDFGPESDVDVLIAFEPQARIGFMALGRMQEELTAIFRRPVDLVPQDGLKPLIRESILSSAEELYAA